MRLPIEELKKDIRIQFKKSSTPITRDTLLYLMFDTRKKMENKNKYDYEKSKDVYQALSEIYQEEFNVEFMEVISSFDE